MGYAYDANDERCPMSDPPRTPRADAGLAARTQEIYERHAARFDAERSKELRERDWLDRFLALVAPRGLILDLGCGAGDPIAGYCERRGFRVIGMDASKEMLAIARLRYPAGDWRLGDMRQLDLPETFDGIIAWDSFFHLTPPEQRDVLGRIGRHLNDGAALLVTVGPAAGEVTGCVGGEAVYHSSLAPDEYAALLSRQGVDVVAFVPEDPRCDGHSVLLGRKGPA